MKALVLGMALLWCSAAYAQIREDMSEQAVIDLLGRPPDDSLTSVCGEGAGKPWVCKVLVYRTEKGNALLTFFLKHEPDGWQVNSWLLR
jgi:hypothetical protein